MCEVEFWEVFYGKNEGFYSGAFSSPLVDCRIAKLVFETTALRFSQRAGKMLHILSGCSFRSVESCYSLLCLVVKVL